MNTATETFEPTKGEQHPLPFPDIPTQKVTHYRLKIERDDDPLNPRKDCDPYGTMVCWHGRYNLGDQVSKEDDPEKHLLYMAEEVSEGVAERFENWDDNYPYPTSQEQWRDYDHAKNLTWNRMVQSVLDREYIILPLYLYDHSGITMNTGGFSCPWDSGQVGYIYISRKDALKEHGWKILTAKRREQVQNFLENSVKEYDCYLRGEGYGFRVFEYECEPGAEPPEDLDEWEEGDSCWGFLGEDWAVEGIYDHVSGYGFTKEQVKEAFDEQGS